MRRRMPIKVGGQISLDPQPHGTRAVYMVEGRTNEEAEEVCGLFAELEPLLEIRQLSKGKLVSYAVKTVRDHQQALAELEQALKQNYGFVILHRSFDEVIYKIVSELCGDTGSELIPVPRCNICGRSEPFPDTVINVADQGGNTVASGAYCQTCTAASSGRNNKDFLLSLLHADSRDFSDLENIQLVRAGSRQQSIRYRIRSRAEHGCAAHN